MIINPKPSTSIENTQILYFNIFGIKNISKIMTNKIRNPISYKNNNNKTKFAHKILLLPHKITNKQTNSTKKTKSFKHQWRERERVLTCDRHGVPTSGAT